MANGYALPPAFIQGEKDLLFQLGHCRTLKLSSKCPAGTFVNVADSSPCDISFNGGVNTRKGESQNTRHRVGEPRNVW